ncbi:MAG: S41 family peptidase, partial [Myxococcota bacterium]
AFACGGPDSSVDRAYRNLRVGAEQCREAAPSELTPRQMADDFAVFERTLRRGYGGYELAGDEAFWTHRFQRIQNAVPRSSTDSLTFRDQLADGVSFLNDNHAGLWLFAGGERRFRGTGGRHQAYVVGLRFDRAGDAFVDPDGGTFLDCGNEQVLRPIFDATTRAVRYAPLLLSREPITEVRCRIRRASGEVVERSPPVEAVDLRGTGGPPLERLEASFPWIRLRTLFTTRSGALEDFVATAAPVREAPVVVLDLRRTGGGSDRYLIRWFRNLTAQSLRYWETDALESEVTLQGARNFWGCAQAHSRTDAGGNEWLDQRIARADRELDEALQTRGLFRERTREALRVTGRAPRRFGGRLLLVVDRGCASACETAVLLARQVPGAVIAGENTGGVMKVGELRWYRLPHSRIWVGLGHRVHRDPFGDFEESIGFLPDVWLDGRDPEADIQRLAECLATADCGEALDFR